MVCEREHSFDMARTGYLNLMQPQDRRSKQPGDTAAVNLARRRLHDAGITAPFVSAIKSIASVSTDDVILDAGCGEGFYAGSLALDCGCAAHGVDISIAGVDAAARRYPECEWVVANADRFIPYRDGAFSRVLSITARMNAEEFRRVLEPGGRLIVGIPAPEDLIELRGVGRDRVERTEATFETEFELLERRRVVTAAELDADGVRDVLESIYRPMGARDITARRVTFGLDLLLFGMKAG